MKRWVPILMAGLACVSVAGLQAADAGLIKITGPIVPVTAGYIARAIEVASARNNSCLIIQLDTPGGLLDSTKQIVQTFYASPVPTVVYVAPSGAGATSAGCFITLAADVAAMAPFTTIGAPHPVSGSGEKLDDVMKEKVENYASSFIEEIAKKLGRNVEWARAAVLKRPSTNSQHAVSL